MMRRLQKCHLVHLLRRARRGSGTVMGIMLVFLTMALLGALVAGSSLVITREYARQEVDLAALSAANAYLGLIPGQKPCSEAEHVLRIGSPKKGEPGSTNKTELHLVSCQIDGSDVVVTVQAWSGPFAKLTRMTSRAGPDDCVEAGGVTH